MMNRLRIRALIATAIALLPLLVAACNKGGSPGY
jgi:hypothetical protein